MQLSKFYARIMLMVIHYGHMLWLKSQVACFTHALSSESEIKLAGKQLYICWSLQFESFSSEKEEDISLVDVCFVKLERYAVILLLSIIMQY
jgi:hypothetical protein